MPDPVICNTSPLFYLHRLGCLGLLQKLYQQIVVPQAVVEELQVGRDQGEDVPDIAELEWIEVRTVSVPQLIGLITDLGPGEAQVLALALEEQKGLVILDDKLARGVANLQKLHLTGTAGVLLRAKREGHVAAISPLLERLKSLNFRLSEEVKARILKLAGE